MNGWSLFRSPGWPGVLSYEKMTSVILLARRIARRGIRFSNSQFLTSSNYLRSIGYERTSYRVDAYKGKDLSQMVAKSYQEIHEHVMPEQQGKRESDRIEHRSHNRLPHAAHFKPWGLERDRSPEQRPFQHEGARPAGRGNNLEHYGLVAPNEDVTLFSHPSEEIRVAASVKLRVEREFTRGENAPLQQHVAGPPLRPVNHEPRRMTRPVEKLAADDPVRRFFVEVALDRAEHAGHVVSIGCLVQLEQPLLLRKLVVVDEGDKLPGGVRDAPVPCQADTLRGFHIVRHGHSRSGGKLQDYGLGGP